MYYCESCGAELRKRFALRVEQRFPGWQCENAACSAFMRTQRPTAVVVTPEKIEALTEGTVIYKDGLFTSDLSRNQRCVMRLSPEEGWIGGVYDLAKARFTNGDCIAAGKTGAALARAYTERFTSEKAALAWLMEA